MAYRGRVCYICKSHEDKEFLCPTPKYGGLEWLKALKLDEASFSLACGRLRLCMKHFESHCFTNSARTKLNKNVVPTLHLSHNDHSYSSDASTPVGDIYLKQQKSMYGTMLKDLFVRKKKPLLELLRICRRNKISLKQFLKNIQYSDVLNPIFNDISDTAVNKLIPLLCVKGESRDKRWTEEEVFACIAFWKVWPKRYLLLRKMMLLPSVKSLKLILEMIPVKPDLDLELLDHLKTVVDNLEEGDNICTLMFAEMPLQEALSYYPQADVLYGYPSLLTAPKGTLLANRVLVFMAQGLRRSWKQPVAFYFCRNLLPIKFAQLIHKVIQHLSLRGLEVVATVCDVTDNYVQALNALKLEDKDHFFVFEERTIFTIYNPPHLLMNTRNMLSIFNISCEVDLGNTSYFAEAKWEHVLTVYQMDKCSPIYQHLNKLTDEHLAPGMQNMAVSLAAEVMSFSVAVTIDCAVARGVLGGGALASARFIHDVDALFDSLNGNTERPDRGKVLRCNLSDSSPHLKFWQSQLAVIESWEYLRTDGTVFTPRSKTGWIVTLKAVMGVWDYLRTKQFRFLRTRSLNTDPLQNFFTAIRACTQCKENPTASQFVTAYKNCLINKVETIGLRTATCEPDGVPLLLNLRSYIFQNPSTKSNIYNKNVVRLKGSAEHFITESSKSNTRSNIAIPKNGYHVLSVEYMAAFIARKVLKVVNCKRCTSTLISNESSSMCTMNSVYNITPTDKFASAIGEAMRKVDAITWDISTTTGITKSMSQAILTTVNFEFLCPVHGDTVKKIILDTVGLTCSVWLCIQTNKIYKKALH